MFTDHVKSRRGWSVFLRRGQVFLGRLPGSLGTKKILDSPGVLEQHQPEVLSQLLDAPIHKPGAYVSEPGLPFSGQNKMALPRRCPLFM